MKKVIAVLLTLVLILTNGITVLAEEVSAPPANQISADPNFSYAIYVASVNTEKEERLRSGEDGLIIVMAESSISKGSGSVTIHARTDSNIISAQIGGTVRIQRWKDNKWNNYYSTNFFAFSTASHSTTKTVSVESGYYYKLYVTHIAITPSTTKSIGTSTQGVCCAPATPGSPPSPRRSPPSPRPCCPR